MTDLARRLNIAAVDEFGANARAKMLQNPNVPTVFSIVVFGSSSDDDVVSLVNNADSDEPFLRSVDAIRAKFRSAAIPSTQ